MSPLFCPCKFRLPLKYNDGTDVEPEVIAEILLVLTRQFGGYTPLGISDGDWQGQTEPMMGVEVAVLPERVPEFKEVVKKIGRQLKQKEMYYDAPPPSVEFLNTDENDKDSAAV